MADSASPHSKLVAVELDPASIVRASPDVEHERAAAIYDLLEDNHFEPVGQPIGDFKLHISVVDQRLVLAITRPDGSEVMTHILSLTPMRKVVRDYFLICDSYYAAIRDATPAQIEAIDMGRRGLHDEGSTLLRERLEGKIIVDHDTSRRLFTLVCALHWKG
jgi:uncharacterized protein (UPF0262 family)